MRAVVADDDRATTLVLARMVEGCGIEALVARDGFEAWELIQHGDVSLTILDRRMPGLDGPEICRRIRRHKALAHIYVVLVTPRGGRSDPVAGADDYLTKPFDAAELRARIDVGIRVLELQERPADGVAELQTARSTVKQLHGLLPICSYCRRVRNDRNCWVQVDHYVTEHTHVEFSHGICPACCDRLIARWESRGPMAERS